MTLYLSVLSNQPSLGVSELASSNNVPCADGDVGVSEVTLHVVVGGTFF